MVKTQKVFISFFILLIVTLPLIIIAQKQIQDIRQIAKNEQAGKKENTTGQTKKDSGGKQPKNDTKNRGSGRKNGLTGKLSPAFPVSVTGSTGSLNTGNSTVSRISPTPGKQTAVNKLARDVSFVSPTPSVCLDSVKLKTVITCRNCAH